MTGAEPEPTTLRAAVEAATAVRHPGATAQPARFALILRDTDDPVARRAQVAADLAPLGGTVEPLSTLDPQVLVAEFPERAFAGDDGAAFDAADRFRRRFDLAAAEPDLPTDVFPEPDRPGRALEEDVSGFPPGCFAPENTALPAAWAIDAVRAPQAWAFSVAGGRPDRGRGAVLAQPDTGITPHPELADVVRVAGFDVLDNDPDPTDPLDGQNPGHGTATASVAVSGPAGTVTGSAPAATHMAIRAVESVVRITQVSVARAIDWAVDHGAHVISMSLGGIFSFTLHRALRRAVAADVVVLAAAGNCVGVVVWPAAYDECLAVAGVDQAGARWRGSSHGAAVDLAAPAENVWRADVAGGVSPSQGTSYAVALTAGVAALWLAHHGRANLIAAARARGETVQDMFRRLAMASARRPPGWDSFDMGAGIVDAAALLAADLDLGRGRELVPPPAEPEAAAALGVAALAAAEIGPARAAQDPPDWYRYGPEISARLLAARLARADAAGPRDEAPAGLPAPSPGLDAAVGNPALRTALGLDGGDAEAFDPETPETADPETADPETADPETADPETVGTPDTAAGPRAAELGRGRR